MRTLFLCIGMYIHAHVHFMRLQRLAVARFCSLQPLQPFSSLRRFDHFGRFPFSRFSRIVSRVHAITFAVRLPKRFQGSFQTVLSRFKRLKFSACTFIPFAPFHALE